MADQVWQVSSPSESTPFDSFKNLLAGLCSPKKQVVVSFTPNQIHGSKGDDVATVCSEQSTHSGEHTNISVFPSSRLDLLYILDPLSDIRHWCPSTTNERDTGGKVYDEIRPVNKRSDVISSSDAEILNCSVHDNDEYWQTDDSDDDVLVETIPGTHRVVRVYKAIELFTSAVILVVATIYLIRLLDGTAEIRLIARTRVDSNEASN
jgi:hypothetical protein